MKIIKRVVDLDFHEFEGKHYKQGSHEDLVHYYQLVPSYNKYDDDDSM